MDYLHKDFRLELARGALPLCPVLRYYFQSSLSLLAKKKKQLEDLEGETLRETLSWYFKGYQDAVQIESDYCGKQPLDGDVVTWD